MPDWTTSLIETGLVQFGRFGDDHAPILVNSSMFPSYPEVLRAMARQLSASLAQIQAERLLCPLDSLPLGVALSLESGIPLVYSLGKPVSGVYDLIGAYDVGHPTALVMNAWQGEEEVALLIKKAAAVGLNVAGVFAVFDFGRSPLENMPLVAVIHLPDFVHRLVSEGQLPPGVESAVMHYLAG